MATQQGHVEPAKLPRRERGKLRVEVGRRREDRAGNVMLVDVVAANHQREQLARGREDFLAVIVFDGGCSADSATCHGNGTEKRMEKQVKCAGPY